MNLLRFYLMIGGVKFDAAAYSIAAKTRGIDTGKVEHVKRMKYHGDRRQTGTVPHIECIFPEIPDDEYFLWESETVNYMTDERTLKRYRDLPLGSEGAQLWIHEETAIAGFLSEMKNRMPPVSDYCPGSHFVKLKSIYYCHGEDEDDRRCICSGYSIKVIKLLAQIGAGFEYDCESGELHFARLKAELLQKHG